MKFHPLIFVEGVKNFLRHARFYRRFINDFSKIVHPLCKLLEKEAEFVFHDVCLEAFEGLMQKLILAPTIVAPNWTQPLEIMYDASGVALGIVSNAAKTEDPTSYILCQ